MAYKTFHQRKAQPPLSQQIKKILVNNPNLILYIIVAVVAIACISIFLLSFIPRISPANNEPINTLHIANHNIILITVTAYKSLQENRYLLAKKTLQAAKRYSYNIITVDSSRLLSGSDEITNSLRAEGAIVFENNDPNCRKGCAFRLAIQKALQFNNDNHNNAAAKASNSDKVIVFFEPEKVDFVRAVAELSFPIQTNQADFVWPHRCFPDCFETLPIEQQHEELFGNLHLNNVARSLGLAPKYLPTDLDWFFGPIVFHSKLSKFFLRANYTQWLSHIIPQIEAVNYYRNTNTPLRLISQTVAYSHPMVQKLEEEGQVKFSSKRLFQLNQAVSAVLQALNQEPVTEML
jgi:hypothetical protein